MLDDDVTLHDDDAALAVEVAEQPQRVAVRLPPVRLEAFGRLPDRLQGALKPRADHVGAEPTPGRWRRQRARRQPAGRAAVERAFEGLEVVQDQEVLAADRQPERCDFELEAALRLELVVVVALARAERAVEQLVVGGRRLRRGLGRDQRSRERDGEQRSAGHRPSAAAASEIGAACRALLGPELTSQVR